MLKYFQKNLNKSKCQKCIVRFGINIENLETLKYHMFFKNALVFLLFKVSVVMNSKK